MRAKRGIISRTVYSLCLPLAVYALFLGATAALGRQPFGSNALAMAMMLKQSAITFVVALALALSLMSGRFDFSIGAAMILSAIAGGNFAMALPLGPAGLLLGCVLAAVALSLITAAAYLLFRLPFMVVSLAMLLMEEALTALVFDGRGTTIYSRADLTAFARFPWILVLLLALAAVFQFVMSSTRLGYDIRSLAGSQELAVKFGVDEPGTVMRTALLAGLVLGGAAALYAAVQGMARATINLSSTAWVFSAVTPVIIGLYLARFSNTVVGIAIGSLTMGLLQYGLVAAGIDATIQNVLGGLFLIGFVWATARIDAAAEARRAGLAHA